MKDHLVNIFRIDEQLIALPLEAIKQIVRSAKVKRIQGISSSILGILNFHGDLLPVVDIRHKLGLESKKLTLEDRFVIIGTKDFSFVIVVSEVMQILNMDVHDRLSLSTLSSQSEVDSLFCLNEDVVMILNAGELLSASEISVKTMNLSINHKKKISA